MSQDKASVLVMKAAGDVRRAAALDRKRAAELSSVADYLESIVFEGELDYEPVENDEAQPVRSQTSEIERLVTPFKVRLSR